MSEAPVSTFLGGLQVRKSIRLPGPSGGRERVGWVPESEDRHQNDESRERVSRDRKGHCLQVGGGSVGTARYSRRREKGTDRNSQGCVELD